MVLKTTSNSLSPSGLGPGSSSLGREETWVPHVQESGWELRIISSSLRNPFDASKRPRGRGNGAQLSWTDLYLALRNGFSTAPFSGQLQGQALQGPHSFALRSPS